MTENKADPLPYLKAARDAIAGSIIELTGKKMFIPHRIHLAAQNLHHAIAVAEAEQSNSALAAPRPSADPLREALQRIVRLDPNAPIGEPADPQYFIRQAQGIARDALATPQPPAPDHLPLPFESAGMRGARKQAERDHASMFPQPAAPLGGREAVALTIQNFAASILAIEDDEIVNVGPFSFACADAILAAIPQERAADPQRLREVLGAFYKTVDVMKSARNSNNKLINVWSDDMKAVEDVMLFLEHLRDATPPVVAGTDRTSVIKECAKMAEDYPVPTGTDDYTSGFGDATNFIAEAIRALAGNGQS